MYLIGEIANIKKHKKNLRSNYICLTCGTNEGFVSVNSAKNNLLYIKEYLLTTYKVNIKYKKVCLKCLHYIKHWYMFKLKLENMENHCQVMIQYQKIPDQNNFTKKLSHLKNAKELINDKGNIRISDSVDDKMLNEIPYILIYKDNQIAELLSKNYSDVSLKGSVKRKRSKNGSVSEDNTFKKRVTRHSLRSLSLSKEGRPVTIVDNNDETQKDDLSCTKCNKDFNLKSDYKLHLLKHKRPGTPIVSIKNHKLRKNSKVSFNDCTDIINKWLKRNSSSHVLMDEEETQEEGKTDADQTRNSTLNSEVEVLELETDISNNNEQLENAKVTSENVEDNAEENITKNNAQNHEDEYDTSAESFANKDKTNTHEINIDKNNEITKSAEIDTSVISNDDVINCSQVPERKTLMEVEVNTNLEKTKISKKVTEVIELETDVTNSRTESCSNEENETIEVEENTNSTKDDDSISKESNILTSKEERSKTTEVATKPGSSQYKSNDEKNCNSNEELNLNNTKTGNIKDQVTIATKEAESDEEATPDDLDVSDDGNKTDREKLKTTAENEAESVEEIVEDRIQETDKDDIETVEESDEEETEDIKKVNKDNLDETDEDNIHTIDESDDDNVIKIDDADDTNNKGNCEVSEDNTEKVEEIDEDDDEKVDADDDDEKVEETDENDADEVNEENVKNVDVDDEDDVEKVDIDEEDDLETIDESDENEKINEDKIKTVKETCTNISTSKSIIIHEHYALNLQRNESDIENLLDDGSSSNDNFDKCDFNAKLLSSTPYTTNFKSFSRSVTNTKSIRCNIDLDLPSSTSEKYIQDSVLNTVSKNVKKSKDEHTEEPIESIENIAKMVNESIN